MTHYLIYKITNNINGKIYIGQHQTEDLNDGYMGSGIAIQRAIKKYGKENFTKEILYDVDDWELMDFIEELIVDEEFVNRKDTYNMTLGGREGCKPPSWKGKHFSEEHRRKIGEAHKGKHRSEETRRKLSEARKGIGHPHTEESKRKISLSHIGRIYKSPSEETRRKMSVSHSGVNNPNYGKHLSEETKRKMSECRKGRHWYNDGIKECFSNTCPEGWTQGRLRKEFENEVA